MPSITLKDVPEQLLVRLRTAAARTRRSLNQEALVLLDDGLTAIETAEARAERQVAAWRSLAGGWHAEASFEEETAALYAARDAGRDVDL